MNEQHEKDILFSIMWQISKQTEDVVKRDGQRREKKKGEEWSGGGLGERVTLL